MSSLSMNVQERFINLRKKLDQLGYLQPLSVDSLPLVENIFTDLLWTTDNFRKHKHELEKRLEVRDRVEDYIEPYKKDNGRILSENNRLQKKIMDMKIQQDEVVRDLQCRIRQLDDEKEDLQLFSEQCLHKLQKYEAEAKQMVERIMELQEKNMQAVINTTDGKRKQIPFRRQRMDIDYFIPCSESNNESSDSNCCRTCGRKARSSSSPSEEVTFNQSREQMELLDTVTRRCQELTRQLQTAHEEIELNDRKLEGYRNQLTLYEDEVNRLTKELCGGRSLEAMTLENEQKSKERLIEQLNMQLDMLQQRNEELEKEIVRTNALNIKEGKSLGKRSPSDNIISDLEAQNKKFQKRIENLVEKEKSLIRELHCTNKRINDNRDDDCIPVITEALEKEIDALHQHIRHLEEDRNYWKHEAELSGYSKNTSDESKSVDIDQSDQLKKLTNELEKCHNRLGDLVNENNELKQVFDAMERRQTPPVREKDMNDGNQELKRVKAERDNLQELLNKFERQLHDIQGNIRVLTQERDSINEKYLECQKEMHDLREAVMSSQPKGSGSGSAGALSAVSQTMLRRLEIERDEAMSDLHRMTTERDSLRERLKTATETGLTEKSRLIQRLEDAEREYQQLQQDKKEKDDTVMTMRNKIGTMEEHKHQLTKKNESLQDALDEERKKLRKLSSQLTEYDVKVKELKTKDSQLSDELESAEERITTLQRNSDSQIRTIENHEGEISKLKNILTELDREKDQMQEDVDKKSEEIRDLHQQLQTKSVALDEVRSNIQSLEQQLRRIQEVNGHRDQEMRAVLLQNDQVEDDLRRQSNVIDQQKAEITNLEDKVVMETRDKNRLESELKDSRRHVEELKNELNDLNKRVEQSDRFGQEQQNQNSDLLEKYRELTLEIEKFQLMLQKEENCVEELTVQVEGREKVITTMREEIIKAEEDNNTLQETIRQLDIQIQSMAKVIDTNQEMLESNSKEKHELLEELGAMRDLCSRLESSKDNLQRQLSSRMLELEQCKSENEEYIRDIEAMRREIDSLQENIRNMETVVTVTREKEFRENMEKNQRIAELESEKDQFCNMKARFDDMCREFSRSNCKITDLETECEKLRRQLTSEKFKVEMTNQELARRQKLASDISTYNQQQCFEHQHQQHHSHHHHHHKKQSKQLQPLVEIPYSGSNLSPRDRPTEYDLSYRMADQDTISNSVGFFRPSHSTNFGRSMGYSNQNSMEQTEYIVRPSESYTFGPMNNSASTSSSGSSSTSSTSSSSSSSDGNDYNVNNVNFNDNNENKDNIGKGKVEDKQSNVVPHLATSSNYNCQNHPQNCNQETYSQTKTTTIHNKVPCHHGCYHSKRCNFFLTMNNGMEQSKTAEKRLCRRSCRHSADCLNKKEKKKKGDDVLRRQHLNPNCPYNRNNFNVNGQAEKRKLVLGTETKVLVGGNENATMVTEDRIVKDSNQDEEEDETLANKEECVSKEPVSLITYNDETEVSESLDQSYYSNNNENSSSGVHTGRSNSTYRVSGSSNTVIDQLPIPPVENNINNINTNSKPNDNNNDDDSEL